MKYFFKYDGGYVNIDDENIYLTTSGNWQETKSLLEKTPQTAAINSKKADNKKVAFAAFYVGILLFLYFLVDIERVLFIAAFLGIGLMFLFYYFRRDFGISYKIPLSKITSVEVWQDNSVTINFQNAFDAPDNEVLKSMDKNGVAFLQQINTQ